MITMITLIKLLKRALNLFKITKLIVEKKIEKRKKWLNVS